jgi:hypothetical protein
MIFHKRENHSGSFASLEKFDGKIRESIKAGTSI